MPHPELPKSRVRRSSREPRRAPATAPGSRTGTPPAREQLARVSWTAARKLLHQQLWCWGQDMKAPAVGDNPLLAEGFVRHARPVGQRGTSRYELVLADGSQVVLWGYGAWFRAAGQRQGTLLLRHRPGPQMVDLDALEAAWFPDQLPEMDEPVTPTECEAALGNLRGLCEWIAGYEERVHESRGGTYRDACHRAFAPERRHCAPAALPGAWRTLLHP